MSARCLPILMYHSIADRPRAATRRLSVTPEALAAQLDLLARLGCTTLTFSAAGSLLTSGDELPERAVVLTFDDGYADFHEQALRELERHAFTATVFVTTGWVDDGSTHPVGTPLDRMLTWKQVRDVAAAGVEVGAHSHSHPQLDQLYGGALQAEVQSCKTVLESAIGQAVESFAYPYGYSSGRTRAAVASTGYRYAAAVTNALASPGGDRLAVPRLTIRRSTGLRTFEQLALGKDIDSMFRVDRALTSGWAVARRARHMVGRARSHG